MISSAFARFRRGRTAQRDRSGKVCIVIPYFGDWPEWAELFFETCRFNPSIHWIILNNCPDKAPFPPENIEIRYCTLSDLLRRAESALDISIAWDVAYKVCDLRLAFGHIFCDFFKNYSYYGWGDLDVVYGNMSKFLSEEVLSNDCVSFCDKHLNGHLCIFRNTEATRYAYRALPDWRERMTNPEYTHFDELAPTELPAFLRTYCKESFNTPLSPYIPWTNGRFEFPREWYWRDGILTNDKDGDQDFLYLHFMHWKGGWWPRECGNAQWEKLDRLVHLEPGECRAGFCINERGFFPFPQDVLRDREQEMARPVRQRLDGTS